MLTSALSSRVASFVCFAVFSFYLSSNLKQIMQSKLCLFDGGDLRVSDFALNRWKYFMIFWNNALFWEYTA